VKVTNNASTGRRAASATHGPTALTDRRRIIVEDLFVLHDVPERVTAYSIAHTRVRLACMVGENARGFEVDVCAGSDLQHVAFRLSFFYRCGQVDDWSGKTKQQFAFTKVSARKHAAAKCAFLYVNRRAGCRFTAHWNRPKSTNAATAQQRPTISPAESDSRNTNTPISASETTTNRLKNALMVASLKCRKT
jgi:hypothetical protein